MVTLKRFIAVVTLLLATMAQAEVIDFEGIGTIAGPPFDVLSNGYTVQQILTQGSPEPIIRPAASSPNGTDVYAICGFCANSSGFNLYSAEGEPFSLVSIDIGGFGNVADEFEFTITGYTLSGSTLTEQLTFAAIPGMQTVVFGHLWQSLSSVTVMVNNAGNAGFSGSAYDNIVLAAAPAAVVIDVIPGDSANKVYPNKSGKLPVAVLSSATFDAAQVDPATLRFGVGQAAPVEAPVIANVDGEHGDDTTVRFQVAGSGIVCNDTDVSLSGETYSGEQFIAEDAIDATQCAEGGCHAY